MTSHGDPIPDSRQPDAVKLKTELPSKETKGRNLSGQVAFNKLDAKYEVSFPAAMKLKRLFVVD
jgi:hypothetical protein